MIDLISERLETLKAQRVSLCVDLASSEGQEDGLSSALSETKRTASILEERMQAARRTTLRKEAVLRQVDNELEFLKALLSPVEAIE